MAVQMQGSTISDTTVKIQHPSGAEYLVVAPKDNGGDGSSFSPTDLCTVSLGACGSMIMKMFAAGKGIPVEQIRFEIIKEMAASPRRIQKMTVVYTIRGALSDIEFRKVEAAGRTCPVRLTLGAQVEIAEEYRLERV
ncbi:MAG: OsmC family protein [Spirochaetes bacterium]|nr:OsmC family protein [Spirochaetota bacterium]MBU0955404.1 OsmC family protein [Spirochaetota bacterium]